MSAKVTKSFEKGFELNEEGLRRLHADIRKRIPDDSHNNILIEVFREDSLVYKTAEIDRVLSESNDSTVKIKSIVIEYKDDNIDIVIIFDSIDGAELTIVGEDRDIVFLIYSDLKEYIQKEICCLRSNISIENPAIIGAGVFFIAATLLLLQHNLPTPTEEIKAITESSDINKKLNFLINDLYRKNDSESRSRYLTLIPLLLIASIIFPFRKLIAYLLPYNTFLIGKQIAVIKRRKSLTNNLFWVVFIGLFISLITGFYFYWLAK